jgi:hypothetical protein
MLVKTHTTFVCGKCNGEFESADDAQKCETMGAEELKFKVGDFCILEYEVEGFWRKKRKFIRGQVVKIEGPYGNGKNLWDAVGLSMGKFELPPPRQEHIYLIWVRFDHFETDISSIFDKLAPSFFPWKYHQSQLKADDNKGSHV